MLTANPGNFRHRLLATLLVLLSALPFSLNGQKYVIDSLKKTLSTVADTQKVRNCIRISYLNTHANIDTSQLYADSALAMAQRLNNRRLIALAKAQLGVHYTSASAFDKGVEYALEAFKVFDTLNDFPNASFAANIIGNAHVGHENNKQALDWYRISRDYAYRAHDQFKIAIALFGLANIENALKVYDSATVHFAICYDKFDSLGRTREAIASVLEIAHIDYKLGKNQEAYDRLMSVRDDIQVLGDKY